MNPQHIELIKNTVPVLRENGVALTAYFYARMLKNNPDLNNVFNLDHQSTGRQSRALASAILAYADNIENPSVLAKAIEHITTKHVSLNIRPEHYAIVGENLLHSISEVLDVPMQSDLIAAWEIAYTQLAEILIGVEKQKYTDLAAQQGGWSGWRGFVVSNIENRDNGKRFTLTPQDKQPVTPAEKGRFISVKVKVPNHSLEQPLQFIFSEDQIDQHYTFEVKAEDKSSEFSVANILLNHYQVGDTVQVTAPVKS